MKIPFNIADFSGGMKGKKGQMNSASIQNVQDLNNILVERNNSLRTRSGAEELPVNLLQNDKLLPFVFNGRQYYFVYDTLLKLNYIPSVGSTSIVRSMGGRRHVDMFSRVNSSLTPLGYLTKERTNHDALVQGRDTISYIANVGGSPLINDATKWDFFKSFDLSGSYLDLHLNLRRLTWESSPNAVFSEQERPDQQPSFLFDAGTYHTVRENTFWWNRMFILDEDFNIITTEIDLANFVSYDSGHVEQSANGLPFLDSEVRNASHEQLQTIRETRYGGSDLRYEVEVMSQGVMFYNREGKLPNMFLLINSDGQTDGVLRDFRTLYLDEVPNGIFKTAPYFTLDEYNSSPLFDEATLRLEMSFIVDAWGADDNLITQQGIDSVLSSLDTFYAENAVTDYANNPLVEFSYNVRDEQNLSDVQKAFLPLTSDSSPAVAIDNIRFDQPDGQVRFASPTLANMDRDFVFPHDSTSVWQNEDLAGELPFIFSPNLVIYHATTTQQQVTLAPVRFSSPILTLVNNAGADDIFALIPITRYAGGAIGKFNEDIASTAPVRVTGLTSAVNVTFESAPFQPIAVYTQVFGLFRFNTLTGLDIIAAQETFAAGLGYFDADDIYHAIVAFPQVTTTFRGFQESSRTGFFSSSETRREYSFTVLNSGGGPVYSILVTNTNQLSKAIGFNSGNYFSSVIEFQGRMFIASREAPDRLIFSSPTDFLEFSVVRSLVNSENDPVATRGGREIFGNESLESLHESNNTLRVITDQRIFTASTNELGAIALADPSDIVTSGQTPLTINNFTYFVSGDNRDILLAVFSERTQRFEYLSVFSALNIDDETLIVDFLPIDGAYRMIVRTEQAIYVGTIIQANEVAWSRLTFNFEVQSISTTRNSLFLTSEDSFFTIPFLTRTDLEEGVVASFKLLSPAAMANLVNVQKTNINYIGMRYHDVTIVGTFEGEILTGSDSRPNACSDMGDVIDVANKNYEDIFDSIEVVLKGGQNRVIYIRGSLGV